MNTHRFTEEYPPDTPIADRADWDEIERVADHIRKCGRRYDVSLVLYGQPDSEETR